MNLFRRLLRKPESLTPKESSSLPPLPQTSGEYITLVAGGENLVDGKQTWEHAEEKKHDLDCMLRCCKAELATMKKVGCVAAPYYFERPAILLHKAGDLASEVTLCENYIREVDSYYNNAGCANVADVRKGPRYQALVSRVSKAKMLLAKRISKTP